MLCYVMLCYDTLRYVMLRYVTLCHVSLKETFTKPILSFLSSYDSEQGTIFRRITSSARSTQYRRRLRARNTETHRAQKIRAARAALALLPRLIINISSWKNLKKIQFFFHLHTDPQPGPLATPQILGPLPLQEGGLPFKSGSRICRWRKVMNQRSLRHFSLFFLMKNCYLAP